MGILIQFFFSSFELNTIFCSNFYRRKTLNFKEDTERCSEGSLLVRIQFNIQTHTHLRFLYNVGAQTFFYIRLLSSELLHISRDNLKLISFTRVLLSIPLVTTLLIQSKPNNRFIDIALRLDMFI